MRRFPARPSFVASVGLLAAVALVGGACGASDSGDDDTVALDRTATTAPVTTAAPSIDPPAEPPPTRPPWLGTRPLPLRPDGFGEIQPTPEELRDRRLPTEDILPPPAGEAFESAIQPVPADVLERSTWDPGCPVAAGDLRYVTVAFYGFDERFHTGELLLHADVADAVVAAFRRLHEIRFPIEEMRITRADELDAPPTGDGNNTGAFVCRPARGTTRWSDHAYGRAVDINPFHNPYVKGDVVLPELASAYADRSWERPGMFLAGRDSLDAFAAIGWGWGGAWSSVKDYMHFSRSGT